MLLIISSVTIGITKMSFRKFYQRGFNSDNVSWRGKRGSKYFCKRQPMTGRWCPNIAWWLGSCAMFQRLLTSIAKRPYGFMTFQGAVRTPYAPPPPPLNHATQNCSIYNQVYSAIFTFWKQAFNESLELIATVHSLMDDIKFVWQLPNSHARAIRFEHLIHSSDVTLVLWLTASHTRVAREKQASVLLHWLSVFTLAVPLFRFALQ